MNFNTSPIAFYTNRASQPFRASYRQKEIAVQCGETLLPFYIPNVTDDAPETCELYDPNTDTLLATLTCAPHLLTHTTTINGVSVKFWIYQGTQSGIFGNSKQGYFYVKIGPYYSDIFRVGALPAEYTEISWQFFDDIITVDGSLISKYVVYKQIFNVPLWKPTYNIEEEGKTNNGVFYAMQQTTKKTCGFSAIVNEAQADVMNLARMADFVDVKSCINGQTRTFQTNQFEIAVKWQSDDVAQIECEFDLFNIVRKYQMSEDAPAPLPLPTPPTPTGNYYIRGTANGNAVTLKIDGTNTSVEVYNGAFVYAYDDKLTGFEAHDANIKTIDFTDSCKLTNITTFSMQGCTGLQTTNFTGCTFKLCNGAKYAFRNCPQLQSVAMPSALFQVAAADFEGMFLGCTNITSVSIPLAVITTGARQMFDGCRKLAAIDLSAATFADATTAEKMFYDCTLLPASGITMPNATFASCTNFTEFCSRCGRLLTNDEFVLTDIFPSFTSAKVTTMESAFALTTFEEIDISAIDLSECVKMAGCFSGTRVSDLKFDKANTQLVTNWSAAFMATDYDINAYIKDVAFDGATDLSGTFGGAGKVSAEGATLTIDATFANVTDASKAFADNNPDENYKWLTSISLPNATFASCTDMRNCFANILFLETLSAPSLNLPASVNVYNMFYNLPELQNVTIGVSGTLKQSVSFAQSAKLTETAITNIVAWLADLTGDPAKTLTLNSTAWANLPAASQTTLAAAIAAKNWNLQN